MKIGIVGSGNMGRAVGRRLAHLGHEVFFGARNGPQASAAAEKYGTAGTNDGAVASGDVLIWTMREVDPARVLSFPDRLDGKIVVDLNNRDYAVEARGGAWFGQSLAERLQEAVPGARVIKAFNTLPMQVFDTDADALRAVGAQTFLAGRDLAAKELVASLARELGLQPIDLGEGPAAFRAAEALGDVIRLLIIDQGRGGRAHLRLIEVPNPGLRIVGDSTASNYT